MTLVTVVTAATVGTVVTVVTLVTVVTKVNKTLFHQKNFTKKTIFSHFFPKKLFLIKRNQKFKWGQNLKTQIVMKLKKSNCDESKNLNCVETHKLKL